MKKVLLPLVFILILVIIYISATIINHEKERSQKINAWKDSLQNTEFICFTIEGDTGLVLLKELTYLGTKEEIINNLRYSLPEYKPELTEVNGEVYVKIHFPNNEHKDGSKPFQLFKRQKTIEEK